MKRLRSTKLARRIAKAHGGAVLQSRGIVDLSLEVTDPLKEALLDEDGRIDYLTSEGKTTRFNALWEEASAPLKQALRELDSAEGVALVLNDKMSFLITRALLPWSSTESVVHPRPLSFGILVSYDQDGTVPSPRTPGAEYVNSPVAARVKM